MTCTLQQQATEPYGYYLTKQVKNIISADSVFTAHKVFSQHEQNYQNQYFVISYTDIQNKTRDH